MANRYRAAFALLLAAASPCLADSRGPGAGQAPDEGRLEADGLRIGRIVIVTDDIFDPDAPGEDHFVFRMANLLHVTTRREVVARQLVIHPGDAYSRAALEESERILRRNGYLYDARVRPVAVHDGVVDVEVRTREVWTLKAGAGFGRSGGTNRTHVGLHDKNFLGLGKEVQIRRTSSVDRTQTLVAYTDPALFGSHVRLDLGLSDNSDGKERRFGVERPFWALDSRWAAGVRVSEDDRVDALYALGEVIGRYRRTATTAEAYAGFSPGYSGNAVHRYSMGFSLQQDRFADPGGASGARPIDPRGAPPFGPRSLSYPWIAYDVNVDRFVRERDREKIGRTEDLDLGRAWHARLGWSSTAFGADANEAVFDASFAAALGLDREARSDRSVPRALVLVSASAAGRVGASGPRNMLIEGSAKYSRRSARGSLFFASLTGRAASKLDPGEQLLLGGDNGLRGYPLRYALGSRSVLFSAEKRFYGDREYFKLFRLGAAFFTDVGRTWGDAGVGLRDAQGLDASRIATRLGWLADVGVGLRVAQSRSAHGGIIHVDLAYPLDSNASRRRVQVLVTTGTTF